MKKIKNEEGKVLGKIANKEEAFWIKLRDASKERIEGSENAIKVESAFVEMCDRKIKDAIK